MGRCVGWVIALAMLLPATATAGSFGDGVSDDRLSLPDGPGSLEGVGDNVSVGGNMGVASHSVAIALPAGFPGATPKLSLGYSSGSGNSELGVGWSLEVAHVERMTARGLPEYIADDRFVANGGEQLVRVESDASRAIYRARFEKGFVRWVWHTPGTAGYWEAQYPDGSRGFFGADRTGATVAEARVEGVGGTFRYHLVESVDVHGHRVRYDYRKTAGGYALLTRIRWLFVDATTARYSVELAYETRSDVLSDAASGNEIRLDERIRAIDVFYEGSAGKERIRGYELTYSATAWLSQLTRVRQFGLGDPTNSRPYPIVHSFEYTQALGAASGRSLAVIPEKLTGASISTGKTTLVDLNGDALPDVVDSSIDGPHKIWLAQLGTDGILHYMGPTSSALGTRAGFPLDSAQVFTIDVNGDGFTDLARADTLEVLINDGRGDWARKESLGGGGPDMTQSASLRFFDWDGDKKIDVLQSTMPATSVFRNAGGGTFTAATADLLGIDFTATTQMADMNGDGILDVVRVETGQLSYRLHLGRGKWSPAGAWTTVLFPGELSGTDLLFAMLEDLNGDSLADLVIVGQSEVKYALNRNGEVFDAVVTVTAAAGGSVPERLGTTTVIAADMNGNGSQDIVWIDSAGTVTYLEMFATRPNLLTRIENGIGHVTDLVYGSTVQHMARSREAGTPWRYRVPFPMTVVDKVDEWDRLTNLHDLTEHRYDDGFYDGTEKQYRGHARVVEKMAGDATQEEGLVESTYDVGATDPYLNGLLLTQKTTSGGRLLSEETHEHQKCAVELEVAAPTLDFPINFACEVRATAIHHEGTTTPVTTETRTEYDKFGNEVKESQLGVVGTDGDEQYSETTFVPRAMTGGAWIINAPYRVITYGVAGGAATESLTYYDGGALGTLTKGLATRVTTKASDSLVLETSRTSYDSKGMVVETIDPNGSDADPTTHRRRYSYDADGLRPIKIQILVGAYQIERRARHDERFNQVVWASDWMRVEGASASGENPTERVYDSFGRLTAIHRPDAASGQPSQAPTGWFTYELGSPSSRVSTFVTLGGEAIKCLDGRGRTYQEKTRTAEGDYLTTGFNVFNSRGEVVEAYQPYRSAASACDATPPMGTLSTKHRYDGAHREILRTLPDGSKETTVYLPLQTLVLDANDNDAESLFANTPTVKRMDGLDRLIAIGRTMVAGEEPSLTTIRYDELGRIATVTDAAGNQKAQIYDLAGRIVEIRDPNSGITKTEFDAAGNVVAKTDARGVITRLAYDGANRLVERWVDGARETTLVGGIYDRDPGCARCSNAAGRMAALVYPDGKDTLGYDVRGRVVYSARALDGFAFEIESKHDERDRLIETKYPDGRTLARSYDDGGRLLAVAGVIDGITYDARGLASESAYANGTRETRSYDDRMRMTSLALGEAQSFMYSRDHVGNLTAVAGTNPAEYRYDAWYRLLEAKQGNETLSYAFDAIDNLLSSKAGQFSYDKARPNAATAAGDLRMEYDAAGNLTKRNGRALVWDGFGRLGEVELDDGAAKYRYGAMEGVVVTDEPHGVTHHIAADFEVQDGLGVIYVRNGLERVARLVSSDLAAQMFPDPVADGKTTAGDAWLSRTDPADERMLLSSARRLLYETIPATTYFGRDHLGSITVETDGAGAVVGRRSYSPFGEVASSTGDADRYGFTGQEHEASGLVRFKFRTLDPVAGRWTSPDPLFASSTAENIVKLGESTTAYAYVANNPSNHVDPTGLYFKSYGRAERWIAIHGAPTGPYKPPSKPGVFSKLGNRLGIASSRKKVATWEVHSRVDKQMDLEKLKGPLRGAADKVFDLAKKYDAQMNPIYSQVHHFGEDTLGPGDEQFMEGLMSRYAQEPAVKDAYDMSAKMSAAGYVGTRAVPGEANTPARLRGLGRALRSQVDAIEKVQQNLTAEMRPWQDVMRGMAP